MSLRSHLNLIIAIIGCISLALGSVFTIINSKESVINEVSSSLSLVHKLMGDTVSEAQLKSIQSIRHLQVSTIGRRVNDNASKYSVDGVPDVFVQFVHPNMQTLSLSIDVSGQHKRINIVADPSDEIIEAWREVKLFLSLLLLLTTMIFIGVFIVIGRALKPVDVILKAFSDIEAGDYSKRLEVFELPEFAQIAQGFNHMTYRLATAQIDNARLSKNALNASENERKLLARELHDEMGQSLTAIKALIVLSKRQQPPEQSNFDKVLTICDHLFSVVRNRMRKLTPPLLHEFGLLVALEELVEQWDGDANVVLDVDPVIDILLADNAIHYYRIIQESLTNILKYARADNVRLSLKRVDNEEHSIVQLTIIDDGVGFNVSSVDWGSGFAGIKERVSSLGGTLSIESMLDTGSQIHINVPLKSAHE